MPYGDVKGYIPENDGFTMKMGSKQKDTEGSFSEKDNVLLKQAPLMKLNEGGQKLDAMDGNADGKIEFDKL